MDEKSQPKELLTEEVQGEGEEEEYEEDGEEEQEESKANVTESEDEDTGDIHFVPEWNDEDILDQPFNILRVSPKAYDPSVPDSPDIKFDYEKLMRNDILVSAKGMGFWDYLAKQMPAHYTWGTKIPLDDVMSWSKQIEEPMLRLPKTLHQLTITVFRLICRVCGDEEEQPSAKAKQRARNQLIKIFMEKTQRLRDEIIMQLIKQVRKNNKKSSVEAAFSLLANVLSISYPSEGLLFPLMNWLINMVIHHKNEGYKDWCRYILARVYYMHLAQDKRYFNPDPMEMAYVTNRKRVKVHLFMPNGAFLTLWIESYHTFEDLKKEALFRLGYKTKHFWRWGVIEFIEYDNKFEERFVENHHNVMDVIASWAPLKEKNTNILKTQFFLTTTASMPYLKDTEFITKFQFQSFALSLYRGKTDVLNEELVNFISFHIAADFGKREDFETMIERRLELYVPTAKGYKESKSQWQKLIKTKALELKGKARMTLINDYMKIASNMFIFAGHVFSAKFRNCSLKDSLSMQSNVLILVAIDGILIMEEQTKAAIVELDYEEITNWGCSKNIFVVSIGEIHALNKYYFEMNQAPVAVWLMNAYANIKVDQTPEEISIETKFKFIHDKRYRMASVFNLEG